MLRRFDDARRKVAFIGASYKFVHQAVRDMIISGQFENTDVWLYDIDETAVRLEHDVIARMARQKHSRITVSKARSRAQALDGADYVVVSVLVGGVLQLAVQIPAMRARGVRIRPSLDVGNPAFRRMLRRLLPIAIGLAPAVTFLRPSR